jgi:CheY-like chemotaxis protein
MEPKGGILTLRAKQLDVHNGIHGPVPQGSYYHLAVEDTGHGIKEEFLEKIFEPFFSTKPPPLGTGLGLSVAHGIVKNHKGEIAVKSTLGQGACFDVYLPRCDSVSALETARQEVLFYGRETILLVDDEPMLLQVFEEMLQALGYHTLSCFSGAEAQALLRTGKEPVHLVISDQTMPGMTGLELAGHLASLNPAPPVILCTGNRDALIRNLKGHDGIKEVVAKPFDMAAISATIRQVLEEVPPVK